MQKETRNKIALAAVILLAPGGFILGSTLAANYFRKKRQRNQAASDQDRDT